MVYLLTDVDISMFLQYLSHHWQVTIPASNVESSATILYIHEQYTLHHYLECRDLCKCYISLYPHPHMSTCKPDCLVTIHGHCIVAPLD